MLECDGFVLFEHLQGKIKDKIIILPLMIQQQLYIFYKKLENG
jgi:hypothetical protein